jgi:hypothetical protein
MHKRNFFTLSLATLLAACTIAPAEAQQSGLLNVDVSNVANNIARNGNVGLSQRPTTLQVPMSTAANVCGGNANVLAQQEAGAAQCTATSTSDAPDNLVQRQIKSNRQY